MAQVGFGIVGPGFIAGVIADAIANSDHARLTAVSSRRIENARRFTANRQGVAAVEGVDSLLARPDVDAVYVATPTVAKEEIALAAIAAGKHVLVDKPFVDHASVLRMTDAAAARGLVFMDATHFVHHPRTAAFRAAIAEKVGSPRSLHTAFYFPFSDRDNIRFDPAQEPMTALGDMAWYSMRAVVEYLRPEGRITKAVVAPERDPETERDRPGLGADRLRGRPGLDLRRRLYRGHDPHGLAAPGDDRRPRDGRFRPGLGEQLRVQESGGQGRVRPPDRDGDAQGRDVRPDAREDRPGDGHDRGLRRAGGFRRRRRRAAHAEATLKTQGYLDALGLLRAMTGG